MKKNKFRSIVGITVLLLVAFIYAHIGKTVSIYDRSADTSEYLNMGPLIEQKAEQMFICAEETLDGIRVKAKVVGQAQGVSIHYTLLDAASGKMVAEGKVDASDIDEKKFHELPFERISGCKGKKYVFDIEVENASVDGYVNFSASPGTETGTGLIIDNNKIDGTMVMRTVTNRFDLETFAVFLGFAAYIVLFVKILYKLFK